MITRFEIFENIKKDETFETPSSGEYVIAQDFNFTNKEPFGIFLKNHIGKVVDFMDGYSIVEYTDIPNKLKVYFGASSDNGTWYPNGRVIYKNEIIHHSKNKKDLEPFIMANKFNI